MSDTAELQRPDDDVAADAATPIANVNDSPADDLDSLLAEFDNATKQTDNSTSEHQIGQKTAAPVQDDPLADLLRSPEDTKRISDLEGEIGSLRSAEMERQSRADFEGFSKKLQAECGPHVDENFARTNLLAMAAERPELEVAWRYRGLTDAQRKAADLEFQNLEVLYHRALNAPDDARKQQALRLMEARGQELGLMMNARKMLDRVWNDVVKRAAKVLPPIDTEQTELRMEIAAAMRGASAGPPQPEPPVNLGRLSDAEYRAHLRDKYNIAGF